jgi:cupin
VFRVNIGRSPSGEWLERSIRHSVAEVASPRAGADVILARLSEVLFIEALRCYVEALPVEQIGWLAGLRDPYVGKGLKLLHGRCARSWTVEELAREVGSRSVLARWAMSPRLRSIGLSGASSECRQLSGGGFTGVLRGLLQAVQRENKKARRLSRPGFSFGNMAWR